MSKSKIFQFICLPLIASIFELVNCSNQVYTNSKPAVLIPFIKYNQDKNQVLAFDGNSQIRLDEIGDLNDAIQNAVNLILELEKETDAKTKNNENTNAMRNQMHQQVNTQMNYKQTNDDKINWKVNQMNDAEKWRPYPSPDQQSYAQNNNQMNNQNDQTHYQPNDYQHNEMMNQKNGYIRIPNSMPLYTHLMQKNYENSNGYSNKDENMNAYSPHSNEMMPIRPMMNNNYANMKNVPHSVMMNGQVFDRNQRYLKRLICKTRKHKKMLSSWNYSNFNSDYSNMFDYKPPNTYNGEEYAQVIRYPVFAPTYMNNYDSDLAYRLYKYRNIFI